MRTKSSLEEIFSSLSSLIFEGTIQQEYSLRLGSTQLALISYSRLLEKALLPAFAHLLSKGCTQSAYTVHLISMDELPCALPEIDWELIHKNGMKGTTDGRFSFQFDIENMALSAIDLIEKRAFYITRSAEDLQWWASGSPLQAIIHSIARKEGMQLTHTAAIMGSSEAVLLTGKGGSGKSTTTLACLEAGLKGLGEDYCLVSPGHQPCVYSIYQSAKLEKQTEKRFPSLVPLRKNGATEQKGLYMYNELYFAKTASKAPLKAIFSLHRSSRDTPMHTEQSKEDALRDLMMSTIHQLPFYHSDSIALLRSIVEAIPTYSLALSYDLEQNAEYIKDFLQ